MKLPSFHRRAQTVAPTHNRQIPLLTLGILSLLAMTSLIIIYPPAHALAAGPMQVSLVPIVFALGGFGLFAVVTFATGSKKHGILVSLFCVIYFWLRLNKLFHPMFTILLIGLFLTLELLFTAKKTE